MIIAKKNNILNPDIENIVKNKERFYNANNKIKFYFGVDKFLNKLMNKKIRIGIITAGQKERLYNSLPLSFLNKFDIIVTSDDYKNGKPSPEPYLLGCKLLDLKIKNCVFNNLKNII